MNEKFLKSKKIKQKKVKNYYMNLTPIACFLLYLAYLFKPTEQTKKYTNLIENYHEYFAPCVRVC